MTTPVLTPEHDVSPEPNLAVPAKPKRKVFLKWSLGITALLFAYLVWQCSTTMSKATSLATDATQRFHQQFNSGEYGQIYSEADLQGDQRNRDEFIEFLAAVHGKMGDFRSSNNTNLAVHSEAGDTTVTAKFDSTYERGRAKETFVWSKANGHLRLQSYDIQSKAFLFNQ